jgi:tetratricopeptide (TPR) repeat protein
VPFDRNPNFTGRGTQLAQLEGKLFVGEQTTKVAITGLGGVGKTQLVLALAYRIREKYRNCSVIWIPATNMESLHQAYLDVARRLSIAGCEEEKADVKRLVQGYLSKESTGQWLLVFDNADDINMWIAEAGSEPGSGRLIEYLPRSNQGCIVFTSRDRKTAVKLAHQNIVEVPEMDEDIATQLLQKCLVNPGLATSGSDTKALLEELTYLPLAIIQAAAYINENGITFADYLSLLADQEEEVIDLLSEEFEDDGRYHNIKNPVATTWLVSFEQIRNRDPLAADYLSFMCCIDSKDIPQSLLPSGPSRKKEIEAIGTLNAYSFITKRPADAALDLHRLVHLSTRNWLRKEKLLPSSTERVIRRLEEVFPDNDHKNRSVWRIYLPHARYVLESNLVDKDWQSRMDLLWRYGMCLFEDGRWNEAEAAIAEVLEIKKRDLGTDHQDTLTSMDKLASTYREQGRWNEAEELELQVVETHKTKFGADHPDTLTSMANLASTYRDQGLWNEAEELKLQVLEARKTKLGADHPDTLTSMANLALTYWDQGRLDEAEELGLQVLEARKTKLGADHPDTLTSMNTLASTYWDQGRWDKAEELDVQVLEARKTKLGANHPDTLTSMNNLASTYRDQGRWDKAEELDVQVLEARKTKLGANHPDTLTSMANLALTYWDQGRLDEAEELEVQVLEARKTKLGADHPETLISMHNLAYTWKGYDRDTEALKLMEECVIARTRILGTNHPDTLSSRKALLEWQTEKSEIGASADRE